MSEQNKPFVITDRRKFTSDGEPRPDADPSPEKERNDPPPAPAAAATPAAGPVAVESTDSASENDAASPESADEPPALTAEQSDQARSAYQQTADRLDTAIRGAARGGVVVMVGLLPSGPQPVQISLAIARELDLRGSFRFNDEIDEVIRALADGTLHIEPVISHVTPWESAAEAFALAADPTISSKVLLQFREE